MKKLLIVRSASFWQLDINLPQIKKQFSDYQLAILTHSSGVDKAKEYECISEIYEYKYNGSFNKKNVVKEIQNQKFDAVIILVTNLTGAFFENAIGYGCSIRAKEYYICNMVSELEKITKFNLFQRKFINLVIKICAGILTVPIGIIYGIVCNLRLHLKQ